MDPKPSTSTALDPPSTSSMANIWFKKEPKPTNKPIIRPLVDTTAVPASPIPAPPKKEPTEPYVPYYGAKPKMTLKEALESRSVVLKDHKVRLSTNLPQRKPSAVLLKDNKDPLPADLPQRKPTAWFGRYSKPPINGPQTTITTHPTQEPMPTKTPAQAAAQRIREMTEMVARAKEETKLPPVATVRRNLFVPPNIPDKPVYALLATIKNRNPSMDVTEPPPSWGEEARNKPTKKAKKPEKPRRSAKKPEKPEENDDFDIDMSGFRSKFGLDRTYASDNFDFTRRVISDDWEPDLTVFDCYAAEREGSGDPDDISAKPKPMFGQAGTSARPKPTPGPTTSYGSQAKLKPIPGAPSTSAKPKPGHYRFQPYPKPKPTPPRDDEQKSGDEYNAYDMFGIPRPPRTSGFEEMVEEIRKYDLDNGYQAGTSRQIDLDPTDMEPTDLDFDPLEVLFGRKDKKKVAKPKFIEQNTYGLVKLPIKKPLPKPIVHRDPPELPVEHRGMTYVKQSNGSRSKPQSEKSTIELPPNTKLFQYSWTSGGPLQTILVPMPSQTTNAEMESIMPDILQVPKALLKIAKPEEKPKLPPPPPKRAHNQPALVNPKQFHRIMARRRMRQRQEINGTMPMVRQEFLHESRRNHALKRRRLTDGRFEAMEESDDESDEDEEEEEDSDEDELQELEPRSSTPRAYTEIQPGPSKTVLETPTTNTTKPEGPQKPAVKSPLKLNELKPVSLRSVPIPSSPWTPLPSLSKPIPPIRLPPGHIPSMASRASNRPIPPVRGFISPPAGRTMFPVRPTPGAPGRSAPAPVASKDPAPAPKRSTQSSVPGASSAPNAAPNSPKAPSKASVSSKSSELAPEDPSALAPAQLVFNDLVSALPPTVPSTTSDSPTEPELPSVPLVPKELTAASSQSTSSSESPDASKKVIDSTSSASIPCHLSAPGAFSDLASAPMAPVTDAPSDMVPEALSNLAPAPEGDSPSVPEAPSDLAPAQPTSEKSTDLPLVPEGSKASAPSDLAPSPAVSLAPEAPSTADVALGASSDLAPTLGASSQSAPTSSSPVPGAPSDLAPAQPAAVTPADSNHTPETASVPPAPKVPSALTPSPSISTTPPLAPGAPTRMVPAPPAPRAPTATNKTTPTAKPMPPRFPISTSSSAPIPRVPPTARVGSLTRAPPPVPRSVRLLGPYVTSATSSAPRAGSNGSSRPTTASASPSGMIRSTSTTTSTLKRPGAPVITRPIFSMPRVQFGKSALIRPPPPKLKVTTLSPVQTTKTTKVPTSPASLSSRPISENSKLLKFGNLGLKPSLLGRGGHPDTRKLGPSLQQKGIGPSKAPPTTTTTVARSPQLEQKMYRIRTAKGVVSVTEAHLEQIRERKKAREAKEAEEKKKTDVKIL